MSGKPYVRRKQIIRALYENGPLSIRGIKCLIEPLISDNGARQSIRLLKQRGLVIPRFSGLPENCANYYQLSLRDDTRPILSKILEVHPLALMEPLINDNELIHSQECAVWTKWFRMMFPDAEVARELQFKKSEMLMRPLMIDYDNRHLIPDIILRMKNKAEDRFTTVAIEVERSRKASYRIAEKLRKLSCETRLDGVIYICANESISETIRHIYLSNIRHKASRVKHYGDNFFLFSNGKFSTVHNGPIMFNSELKQLSLFDWINFLVTTKDETRMRANQELMANAHSSENAG
ncbi:MAG: hypothetical protein ABL958_03370 [Bdellovibrionia bacterium]